MLNNSTNILLSSLKYFGVILVITHPTENVLFFTNVLRDAFQEHKCSDCGGDGVTQDGFNEALVPKFEKALHDALSEALEMYAISLIARL